jgi:methylmalonyl-CoA/ethylmalonyl-CoA epimerase
LTGNGPQLVLDHIGIAVRSIDRAIAHWQSMFGYHQATEVVLNTRQRVRVVFLEKDDSLPVKLIEPADDASPVAPLARRGGGLHHLCFRAPSVATELTRLEALGLRVLVPPEPGEAFEDEPIAFVYAGDGLDVELIDTGRRAHRLPAASHGDATDGAI